MDLEGLWGPETFCLEDSDFGHIHTNTAHSCWLFIAQETGNTKARGWALQNNLVTNSELPKGIPYRHLSYIHVCTHTPTWTHSARPRAWGSQTLHSMVACAPIPNMVRHRREAQPTIRGKEEVGLRWAEPLASVHTTEQTRARVAGGGQGPGSTSLSSDSPVGGLTTCTGTQQQSPLQPPRGVCSPGRSEHMAGRPWQRSAGAPAIKSDCAQQLRVLLLVSKSVVSFVQVKPHFEAEWTHSTVAGTHFILHPDARAAWRSRVLAGQPHAPPSLHLAKGVLLSWRQRGWGDTQDNNPLPPFSVKGSGTRLLGNWATGSGLPELTELWSRLLRGAAVWKFLDQRCWVPLGPSHAWRTSSLTGSDSSITTTEHTAALHTKCFKFM